LSESCNITDKISFCGVAVIHTKIEPLFVNHPMNASDGIYDTFQPERSLLQFKLSGFEPADIYAIQGNK
jgi:hypothetical protein